MHQVFKLNARKTKQIIDKAIIISDSLDEVRFFYKDKFCLSILPDGFILDINNSTYSISKTFDSCICYGIIEDLRIFYKLVKEEYASRKFS